MSDTEFQYYFLFMLALLIKNKVRVLQNACVGDLKLAIEILIKMNKGVEEKFQALEKIFPP